MPLKAAAVHSKLHGVALQLKGFSGARTISWGILRHPYVGPAHPCLAGIRGGAVKVRLRPVGQAELAGQPSGDRVAAERRLSGIRVLHRPAQWGHGLAQGAALNLGANLSFAALAFGKARRDEGPTKLLDALQREDGSGTLRKTYDRVKVPPASPRPPCSHPPVTTNAEPSPAPIWWRCTSLAFRCRGGQISLQCTPMMHACIEAAPRPRALQTTRMFRVRNPAPHTFKLSHKRIRDQGLPCARQ